MRDLTAGDLLVRKDIGEVEMTELVKRPPPKDRLYVHYVNDQGVPLKTWGWTNINYVSRAVPPVDASTGGEAN
jgi:hypothetical protein